MDLGYPKYISEDFPGLNTTINAAFYKDGEDPRALDAGFAADVVDEIGSRPA